jgi:hypothetical protein
VLAYLSRYTHRFAISNRRLIALDQRRVTFKVKNYRISPMVVGCGSRCGVPASGALMTGRSQGPRRPCSRAALPNGRS